jgi:hypothetical protein
VVALDRGSELLAEHAQHRRPGRFDDCDVAAESPGGARDFAPDEPAADHHDSRCPRRAQQGPQVRAQPGAVVQGADHVPAAARSGGAGHAEPARAQPGGDDQAVEADGGAVGQREDAAVQVGGGDRGAEPELDVGDRRPPPEGDPLVQRRQIVSAVPPGLGGAGQFVGEQFLRQRGPVVGQVRLGADDRDRAGVPGGPQLLRRPESAESGARDDDVPRCRRMGHESGPLSR